MCKSNLYILCGIFILLLPVKANVPVLIFPPSAPIKVQWINGIGIPRADLLLETMTTGYVFKAGFALPKNVTESKTQFQRKFGNQLNVENFLEAPVNVPHKTVQDFLNNKQILLSSYRWTVYSGLEGLADRIGLSGRDCVLKSICEAAETPFHYFNGLFGELLHILLTPSSSAEKLSSYADNEYYHAEYLGRSGANCHRIFKDCPRSLLDHVSDIQNISDGVLRIMG